MMLSHLPDNGKSLPLRIAEAVRQSIVDGRLQPGTQLPSSRVLAEAFKIHRHTITAGLDQLVEEGWLTVERRSGYSVNIQLPATPAPSATRSDSGAKLNWKFAAKIDLEPFSPGEGHKIEFNFQSGLPDLSLFPMDEFRQCMNESMKGGTSELLDYSDPLGLPSLRREVATYIGKQRGIEGGTTVITNGSQEAVYLLARLLLKPGDEVGMEEISYPPARETFRLAGGRVVPIGMRNGGIDPEALVRVLQKHKLKLLFLTPTHQFPTTGNLGAAERLAIYQIAARHRIAIIEDDYDHEFHFNHHPPPPLASNDPHGLVLYVSTFSKVSFPGARIGFMVVPREVAEQVATYRRLTVHQNDALMQECFMRWIANGSFGRHLRKMTKIYEQRRDAMCAALEAAKSAGNELSWSVPLGGMALWLNVHRDSERFAEAAASRGVFVTPESVYHLRKSTCTHLRLGFSNLSERDVREGIQRIF